MGLLSMLFLQSIRDWLAYLEGRRNEWADSFRAHQLLTQGIRAWKYAVDVILYKREATRLAYEFRQTSLVREHLRV